MLEPIPEISIIVPTYNSGHFLEECLASIYQQTGPTFEIIVVDDGSNDDTKARLSRHLQRLQYVYQDNAGVAAARNAGIRLAKGRYIQFLDADDLLAPCSLELKYLASQQSAPNTISVCKTKCFTELSAAGTPMTGSRWGLPTSSLAMHLCRLNIAPPHAYFLPRSVIDKVGYFKESYKGCEDYDFWLRALGAGFSFEYLNNTEVYYRRSASSKASEKARVGVFHFDVVVHLNKHDGSYGDGVAKVLQSISGMLAMADGMLRTALKIDPEANREGREELLGLVVFYIEKSLEEIMKKQAVVNFESRLFMQRILQLRKVIVATEDDRLIVAVNRMWVTCRTFSHCVRDVGAMYPFVPYERQLLMYARFFRLSRYS